MYMAETLNYPLFIGAFYVLARWVEAPTVQHDWIAGGLLSAMLLTKLAAWSLVAAVLITVVVLSTSQHGQKRFGLHALRIFSVIVASQIAWQIFKYAHHAAGLGSYGHALGDFGLSHLSARLLGVYFGDFLLAPGLFIAVPLFLWFRENGRKRFPLAVLLAGTLACQIGIHGFLEAGLTGELRERLFCYSLPIMAIFAVKGIQAWETASNVVKLVFIAAPLVLLWLVSRYPFPFNPAVDVPWVSMLGSFAWISVDSFTKSHFIAAAAIVIALAGIVLALLPRRWAQGSLAVFIFFFHSSAFAGSTIEMAQLSARGINWVDAAVRWLSLERVNPGDRLIICGRMAYYEERHRSAPVDAFFINWEERFGFNDIWLFQLEAFGRYDVRMAQTADQIREIARYGDRVLSATRLTELELTGYQYPLYLYTVRKPLAVDPRPLYTLDLIPEDWNQNLLSPPMNLPRGMYRATVPMKSGAHLQFSVEVVRASDHAVIAQRRLDEARTIGTFDFSAPGDASIQLHLEGPGDRSWFEGLTFAYLGPAP
jgi:hypothetical protein